MITLETTKTLAMGGASGQVIYTVDGMELNTSTNAETYKIIVQGAVPASATTVYTVGATTSTFIKTIFFASNSATAETLVIYVGGTAVTNEIMNVTIPIAGSASFGQDGWKVYDSQGTQLYGIRGIQQIVAGGNTAGVMANISTGTMSIAGGNNITLSQNANSITISAFDQPMSFYDNMATAASATIVASWQSLQIFPLIAQQFFPAPMTVNSWWFDMSCNVTTAAAGNTQSSAVMAFRVGLYTVNGNSLSLINSAAKTLWTTNNTVSVSSQLSQSMHGNRWCQLVAADWSGGVAPSLNYSRYYVGINLAVSSGGATSSAGIPNLTVNWYGQSLWNTAARSGWAGSVSTANNTSQGMHPFMGILSVSTNAIPVSVAMSDINKQIASGNFIPHIILNNLTSAF